MVLAFVTINTVPDKIENVLEEVKKIDCVEEAHMVYGVYDIIAKIRATNIKELRESILQIRKMPNVSHTSIQRVIKKENQKQFHLRTGPLSVPLAFQLET